jgi:sugar lactone lactonase YvrE
MKTKLLIVLGFLSIWNGWSTNETHTPRNSSRNYVVKKESTTVNPLEIGISGYTSLSATTSSNPAKIEWLLNGNLVQTNYPTYQNGVVIAGDGSVGDGLNQFNGAAESFVASDGSLYVSDRYNGRVLKWTSGATQGIVVANGLSTPLGVWVDNANALYVVEYGTNSISKWDSGASFGITVAGGNGAGSALNQFNGPHSIYGDNLGSVYVTDQGNNRVTKWTLGASTGVIVANDVANPQGIFVDADNAIYVVELGANKVSKWSEGSTTGTTVAGGNGYGTASNQLANPIGVFVDKLGSIYVSDWGNGRVSRWNQGGIDGDILISNLLSPLSTSIDANGNLIVLEEFGNRVTSYSPSFLNFTYQPSSIGLYSAKVYDYAGNSAASNSILYNSQTLCYGAKVSNLNSIGTNIKWYSAETGGIPLTTNTLLTTSTYYFSETVNAIESSRLPALITINPKSVAGSISGAGKICYETNKVLTLSDNHVGSVQWQSSYASTGPFSDINGATSNIYYTENLTSNTYFRAIVTSGVCSSAITPSALVIVSPQSVAGSISGGNITVCPETNTTVLSLSGYVGSIQWQSSPSSNFETYTILSGTAANYTVKNISTTTYYRAVVTSGGLSCSSDTSIPVAIFVSVPINTGIVTGSHLSCYYVSTTLQVSGYDSGSTIQWQKSLTNTANSFATITGATSNTFETPFGVYSTQYYRALVSKNGCSRATTGFGVVVQRAIAGKIIAPTTACLGTPTTLSLVNYTGPIIQWYGSSSSSGPYTAITGANSSSYIAPNNSLGYMYYKASVAYTGCKSVFTSVVKIYTNPCSVAKTIVDNDFKVFGYPNPFTSSFSIAIDFPNENNIAIRIFDMLGKLIEQKEVKSNEISSLNLGESYPAGIYNIVVTQGTEVKTMRMIKQ